MSENLDELISKRDAIMAICAGFRVMNEEEDKHTVIERCKANVMKKKGYKPDRENKALELIGYLKDRPCEVCEFHKENGCSKWNCVFNGALGIKDI